MKPLKTLFFASAFAGFALSGNAAAVIGVAGITGHDGGNWPSFHGHLTDMVNGSDASILDAQTGDTITTGMDTSSGSDPAAWTWSGNYQQTWHANSVLSGTDSGKIGWVAMDFGDVVDNLENAYLWASSTGQTGGGAEQVQNYKLWYSSGVGIDALPAMPNSQATTGDYDFTVGDWQQVGTTHTLGQADGAVSNIIDLGGVSAQYIGIEVMSIYGVDNRMAIAQIEFTAVPEPSTLALIGLGGMALFIRRRR